MPKLNTPQKLAVFIASLILIFLNVTSYYKGEVADLVSGNFTQPYITPAVNWISQWTVLITLCVIIGLIILGVVNYFHNRKTHDTPSNEVKAINELTQQLSNRENDLINELKGLREDLRVRQNNKPTKQNAQECNHENTNSDEGHLK